MLGLGAGLTGREALKAAYFAPGCQNGDEDNLLVTAITSDTPLPRSILTLYLPLPIPLF